MFIQPQQWEEQFFQPRTKFDVIIPVDDVTSYTLYPNHNWVYNKISLMETQNISTFPHGVIPSSFPVFSKPITNLYGMSRSAHSLQEWKEEYYNPGHFWMPLLTEEQYTTDLVIISGKIQWMCSMLVEKDNYGSFKQFSISFIPESITKVLISWIDKYLSTFTGVINIETIGNYIIECHLRLSAQFVDLYGNGWIDNVISLYKNYTWKHVATPTTGYSCVLRATTLPSPLSCFDPSDIIEYVPMIICAFNAKSNKVCFIPPTYLSTITFTPFTINLSFNASINQFTFNDGPQDPHRLINCHQVRILQDPQMFRHRGTADREGAGDVCNGQAPFAERAQDGPASRVCQRPEHVDRIYWRSSHGVCRPLVTI